MCLKYFLNILDRVFKKILNFKLAESYFQFGNLLAKMYLENVDFQKKGLGSVF